MKVNLDNLEPFRVHSAEMSMAVHFAHMPRRHMAGFIGRMGFAVTEDHDGQIEVSVSVANGRATQAHVEALCRHLGAESPARVQRMRGGGLFWIAQEGVRH